MRIMIAILVFLLFHSSLLSQTFTILDIKKLADKIDNELKGKEINEGVRVRGCISVGRILVYQYDVLNDWLPQENMKAIIIENYIESGISELYFNNDIDVDFLYYTGNNLRKKISIKSNEFSNLNFSLGNYISIKGHSKAKGVELKLKQPLNWELKEGDRPNIVKKFVYNTNIYMILIKDNIMFVSRNEAKELLANDDVVTKYLAEAKANLKESEILNYKVVTIDTYPTLEYTVRGFQEKSGFNLKIIMKSWMILFEDKVVFLQAAGSNGKEFYKLEELYDLITNSVIFSEQYN